MRASSSASLASLLLLLASGDLQSHRCPRRLGGTRYKLSDLSKIWTLLLMGQERPKKHFLTRHSV